MTLHAEDLKEEKMILKGDCNMCKNRTLSENSETCSSCGLSRINYKPLNNKVVDCSCYHDEVNFIGKRGVCWGTKEMEPCSCGGDAAKCDFYDYVRDRARERKCNYNRVTSMNIEELANYLVDQYQDGVFMAQGTLFDRKEREYYVNRKIEWLKEVSE